MKCKEGKNEVWSSNDHKDSIVDYKGRTKRSGEEYNVTRHSWQWSTIGNE